MQPICQVQDLVLAHGKVGFENNPEKLEEGGFPHMQTQGCTCLPSGTSPHADAGAGSLPGVQD